MPVLFLLRKYLVPKEGNLLSFALWVSVAGVSIGIIQLILVLSVMSGFLSFLKDKYTDISSEIVVLPRSGVAYQPQFKKQLLEVEGIEAVSPFQLGQGMLIKDGVAGATLEGIDLESSGRITPWPNIWLEKPDANLQLRNPNWIWLGTQLATKLRVKVGDSVRVMITSRENQVEEFTVTAITKFGLYDHDLHYARIDLGVLTRLFRREGSEPFYKVRLKSGTSLESTVLALKAKVNKKAQVKPWNEINQNLFLAVQDQKERLFLVLEIIVGLAGINVISLLLMSAHYRKRDIAILRSMGFRARGVFLFFLGQGAVVGTMGVLFGTGFGILACKLAEKYQPAILSESVYNVTRLPFKVQFKDLSLISVAAFLLCLVFSAIPAFKAARTRPVEALRYE